MLDEVHASPRTPKDATQPQTRLGSPTHPRLQNSSFSPAKWWARFLTSSLATPPLSISKRRIQAPGTIRMNEAEKRVKILEVFHETVRFRLFFVVVVVVGFFLSFRLSRSFPCPHFSAVSTLTNGQKDFFTVRLGSIRTKRATWRTLLFVDS